MSKEALERDKVPEPKADDYECVGCDDPAKLHALSRKDRLSYDDPEAPDPPKVFPCKKAGCGCPDFLVPAGWQDAIEREAADNE